MFLRKYFFTLSPLELAKAELDRAQRGLLEAQSGVEYAKAMVQYQSTRAARLVVYIAQAEADARAQQPCQKVDS